MIISGEIKAGERLSVNRLTQAFDVSRNTVENALEVMKNKGVVDTIPKSGTFVTENAWRVLSGGLPPDWETISSFGHHKSSGREIMEIRNRHAHAGNIVYSHSFTFYEADFQAHSQLSKAMEKINTHGFRKQLSSLEAATVEAKKAVAEHMGNYGIDTGPENILFFSNNFQALSAICFALLKRGSNLLRMNPDFMASTELLNTMGVNHIILKHDAEGILPEDLERKLSNNRHNILAINPINQLPTGLTTSTRRMKEILKLIQKHKTPVIENCMFRDLWRTPPPPSLKCDDTHDQVIYISTLFITRYAWAVVPDGVVSRLRDVSFQIYGDGDPLSMALLTFMLKSGFYMETMRNVREVNRQRLPLIEKMLEKHLSGIARWHPERLDYHLTLEFDKSVKTEKIFHDCKELSFLPGSYFSDPSLIVLSSVCESLENTDKCLAIIAENVKTQLSKTK